MSGNLTAEALSIGYKESSPDEQERINRIVTALAAKLGTDNEVGFEIVGRINIASKPGGVEAMTAANTDLPTKADETIDTGPTRYPLGRSNGHMPSEPLSYKGAVYDPKTRKLDFPFLGSTRLNSAEGDLLIIFITHPAQVLANKDILSDLDRDGFLEGGNYLRQSVFHLRRKIGDYRLSAAKPVLFQYINYVPGVGYIFDIPDQEQI